MWPCEASLLSKPMTLFTPQTIQTDIWVRATWEVFTAAMDAPHYEEGRGYFDSGYMKIEMSPLGAGQGRQNGVMMDVVSLFSTDDLSLHID